MVAVVALYREDDSWAVFLVKAGLSIGHRLVLDPSDRVSDGVRVATRENRACLSSPRFQGSMIRTICDCFLIEINCPYDSMICIGWQTGDNCSVVYKRRQPSRKPRRNQSRQFGRELWSPIIARRSFS